MNIDWNKITDLNYDGYYYIFTDKDGKQARLDKESVIIAVSDYKLRES